MHQSQCLVEGMLIDVSQSCRVERVVTFVSHCQVEGVVMCVSHCHTVLKE